MRQRIRKYTRLVFGAAATAVTVLAYAMAITEASGVLSTQLQLRINAVGSKAVGIGTATDPNVLDYSIALSSGTGANQASNTFHDQRTITASSSESLDLAGTLTNAFGVTLTFTKIKAVIIHAAAANVNDVLVGGAASNAWLGWVGDVTDVVKVKPGGTLVWIAPDVNGGAVVASTGDLLKVANSSSGTSIVYDITIIGVD